MGGGEEAGMVEGVFGWGCCCVHIKALVGLISSSSGWGPGSQDCLRWPARNNAGDRAMVVKREGQEETI